MRLEPLRIAFATPEYVTEKYFDGGIANYSCCGLVSICRSLAEKIISAWIYPELEEMGAAARRKTLDFSPDKTVETLVNYYREILNGPAT